MKVKVNCENVVIDVKTNVNGELSRRIVVNFDNNPSDYYRLGEFLEFAERKLLTMKHSMNFDEVALTDVTKFVSGVFVEENKTKYGTSYNVYVHFECGLDVKIPCTQADFRILTSFYNANNPNIVISNNTPVVETVKNDKK